jgi:signal transduction histidine kinase
MAPVVKVVGPIDPVLIGVLEAAGYTIRHFDDGQVSAEELEGLETVLLADVGRHTSQAIAEGLRRDNQATQRFFLRDPVRIEPSAGSSEQELRALTEFTQAVTRSLARSEIVDAAIRFLNRVVGVPAVALHFWSEANGVVLGRSTGFDDEELARLQGFLSEIVNPSDLAFRQGIRFDGEQARWVAPTELDAIIPMLAKDELMGVLSVRLGPSLTLSTATLKAMTRQIGLSLHNGELLERAEEALASVKRAHESMTQSEKLAAVGLLAAGIAHEINNPASFIITNLTVLTEYMEQLLAYGLKIESEIETRGDLDFERIIELRKIYDIQYLREDTPDLINRCLKGMHRIRHIVQDLRSFAHRGSGEEESVDVNEIIAQVLKLAGAELRHRARVELDLRPVPEVTLESTRLLQVLLNLIINAYQSFGDRPRSKNAVWVGSSSDNGVLQIYVADNGCGMSKETVARIFEPFFTTKEVGVGTGLGLAVSYEYVRAMRGQILVESTPGRGSRFTIELPTDEATVVTPEVASLESTAVGRPPLEGSD